MSPGQRLDVSLHTLFSLVPVSGSSSQPLSQCGPQRPQDSSLLPAPLAPRGLTPVTVPWVAHWPPAALLPFDPRAGQWGEGVHQGWEWDDFFFFGLFAFSRVASCDIWRFPG